MRIRSVVAAALALVVPITSMAQPVPIAESAPPPIVNAQIVVPVPVVAQPAPPPMMGPRTLPYEEGGPIPPGYVLGEKARLGLVIAGPVILGVLYLFSLMAYTIDESLGCVDSSCDHELWPLAVPVIGPFVTVGTAQPEQPGLSLLIMDGLGQGAGLAMLILGVVSKKQVWVRADLAGLHVAPVAFAHGGRGLALSGQF